MPAANRIRPLDVMSPSEWAELSRRSAWRGPLLIAHAWGLIFAAMVMVAAWPNLGTVLLAIMIVGTRQLGLAILMHEAAHNALHPNIRVNNWLGQWLCAAPVGAHLASYRSYHLKHHRYVQQAEDPDLGLAAPFPTSKESLRRKIFRDVTGQTFLKQRFGVIIGMKGIRRAASEKETNSDNEFVAGAPSGISAHLVTNGVLALALWAVGYWWLFPIVWIGALATWFPFVTRIRNIGEHACIEDSDDPLSHARTTHANWSERLLIAPYWVHYHAEHHAFMHLPCYRLKAAHELLISKGHGDRIPQATGYGEVLAQAMGEFNTPVKAP